MVGAEEGEGLFVKKGVEDVAESEDDDEGDDEEDMVDDQPLRNQLCGWGPGYSLEFCIYL